jgi:hypothetical protein
VITFYVRLTEDTFTTDPERVADAFLDSPQSRRLREAPSPDARAFLLRHLDGPLSRYLQSRGAGWERDPRQPDPHRTRAAYETVYRAVRARLTPPPPSDTVLSTGK